MDIETLLKALKIKLLDLAKEKLNASGESIEKEIDVFLKNAREKLDRWTTLYNSGAITAEELEWLLKSQRDIIEMNALQKAGVSKIKVNNLKKAIINTIFSTIVTSI